MFIKKKVLKYWTILNMKSRSKDIRYIKKFEGIVSNKTDLRINL